MTCTAVGVHLLLVQEGRVLLQRRQGTRIADGLYCPPCGSLEEGETALGAMYREADEEMGIVPTGLSFAHTLHLRGEGGQSVMALFFLAHSWQGELRNREPDKCGQLLWAPLGGLPPNMVRYAAQAIAEIQRGMMFSSYGWEEDGIREPADRPSPPPVDRVALPMPVLA